MTGKYSLDTSPPADTRAGRKDKRILELEWRPESIKIAQEIARHAELRNMSPGNFALAWVLANGLVTSAIAGPRTEEQWDDYMAALDCHIGPEDEALIDRLVAPGHASTHGFIDPGRPIFGRSKRTTSV